VGSILRSLAALLLYCGLTGGSLDLRAVMLTRATALVTILIFTTAVESDSRRDAMDDRRSATTRSGFDSRADCAPPTPSTIAQTPLQR
jgi:hypothetical protein